MGGIGGSREFGARSLNFIFLAIDAEIVLAFSVRDPARPPIRRRPHDPPALPRLLFFGARWPIFFVRN